jgi:type 2 lantibiotic biosynthesis protein LanM
MPDRAPGAASDAASPWWQHADWYRAVMLAERLTARRGATASPPMPAPWQREQAQHRLQDWKAQPPFQHGSSFADRLAADGLTEPELLDLLTEPPEALQARLAPPTWLEALRQALDWEVPATDLPEGATDERNPVAGFLPALHPLLAWGRSRLLLGIEALEQQYPHVPIDVPAVVPSLVAALSRRLLAQASRVFALELQVASRQWRLAGATPEARFDAFVQRLCQREVKLSLLEEYAVLARQLVQIIEQWVAATLEMMDRLCADWQVICATFSPEDDPGLLREVGSDAGDRHRGGRSVLLLRFASGWRLVYKPRSLAVDQHFQDLLCWLNARGAEPIFQPLRVLDRGAYGWSAFVAEQACGSEEEVRRFYERQGAYLALLYVLEGTDLHCENVIAAGEHPMLVDLETLFQPRSPMDVTVGVGEPAFEALQRSVARVGLLPHRLWGNEEVAGVDISGLGGEDGQLSPRAVPEWEGAGTDQLRLVRVRREMPISQNRPRLHGQGRDAAPYRDCILAGFTRMYRLLRAHRDTLLSEVLPRFAQDDIRFIARPTDLYARLLYDSFRPELLRDALDRERHFDRLWISVRWQPALARLIPAERANLLQGDVPVFTTRPGCRDLFTNQGAMIPAFFHESSLDTVRQRLCQLDEADLARQVGIINASFDCLLTDPWRSAKHPAPSLFSLTRVTHATLLGAACAVGDALAATAVRSGNTAGWLELAPVRERDWTLQPAGLDLYNGLPGITLFLAYLAALTGEQRCRCLAEAALQNIRALLTHPRKQEVMKGVGAFDGWGGLIYLLSHLGSLWKKPALFQEAEALGQMLPELIDQDEQLDIIGGAAGCLAGLLSLYAVAPSPTMLELARHCGKHLLASAQPMPTGIGWKVPQQDTPLTGFSHGAAGIALSLLRLAAVSGDECFRHAALAAMAYERSVFSPQASNWPDLRRLSMPAQGSQTSQEDGQRFMAAWCHGAPGIGLARLASLPYLDNAMIRQEIAAALQTTLKEGVEHQPILCCGPAGRLETLLVASQMLEAPHIEEMVMQRVGALLGCMPAAGGHTASYVPIEPLGLMTGLAGIGYTLLRVAAPERVPSILALDPPLPSMPLPPQAQQKIACAGPFLPIEPKLSLAAHNTHTDLRPNIVSL